MTAPEERRTKCLDCDRPCRGLRCRKHHDEWRVKNKKTGSKRDRARAALPKPVRARYRPPAPSDDRRPLNRDELEQASCAQVGDHVIFFREKGETYAEAETVCRHCPIAARCLGAALGTKDEYGFRAASPPYRKRLLQGERSKQTLGDFWKAAS